MAVSFEVLDDLADQYEFKEAGEQLKRARALTASLIKTEKAASCDYVENNRRETAIAFVLDAYNGKVDTALAKVKHNNFLINTFFIQTISKRCRCRFIDNSFNG